VSEYGAAIVSASYDKLQGPLFYIDSARDHAGSVVNPAAIAELRGMSAIGEYIALRDDERKTWPCYRARSQPQRPRSWPSAAPTCAREESGTPVTWCQSNRDGSEFSG